MLMVELEYCAAGKALEQEKGTHAFLVRHARTPNLRIHVAHADKRELVCHCVGATMEEDGGVGKGLFCEASGILAQARQLLRTRELTCPVHFDANCVTRCHPWMCQALSVVTDDLLDDVLRDVGSVQVTVVQAWSVGEGTLLAGRARGARHNAKCYCSN